MLDTARALYADLEQDPRVLYITGFGEPVTPEDPAAAWPWNAVRVRSDSVVEVTTPGNLREAARAYYNYAVRRMRLVRGADPDVPCDSLVRRDARVLASFAEGWIVTRTLFGGPAFAPLDEVAFARDAGHLPGLLAVRGSTDLGICAGRWAEAHPEAVEAYERWRRTHFSAGAEELQETAESGAAARSGKAPADGDRAAGPDSGDAGDARGASVPPAGEAP